MTLPSVKQIVQRSAAGNNEPAWLAERAVIKDRKTVAQELRRILKDIEQDCDCACYGKIEPLVVQLEGEE
jgi:hypothetical protein